MESMITKQDIDRAKTTNLCEVAASLGYTPIRIGSYHTLKEMDSVRIYNKSTWYRWSDGTGGSQIDFLIKFAGMDFLDSVRYLVGSDVTYSHIESVPTQKPKVFTLPDASLDNTRLKY